MAVHTHVKKDEAGTTAAIAAGAKTAAEVMAAAGQPLAPEAAVCIRQAIASGKVVDSPETVTLTVSGYLRGRPLHERQALHLAGIGTFLPGKVLAPPQPFPMASGADAADKMKAALDAFARGDTIGEAPKLASGISPASAAASSKSAGPVLASLAPEDTTSGEQTWPTMEEMRQAESGLDEEGMPVGGARGAAAGRDGAGTGTAAMDGEPAAPSASSSSSSSSASSSSGAAAMEAGDAPGPGSMGVSSEAAKLGKEYEKDFARAWMMGEDDDDEDEDEDDAETYGNGGFPEEGEDEDGETARTLAAAKLAEMEARRALREEEKEFPDEVETPIDVPAAHRFGKYRGLKSESRSEWRTDESLPRSYGRLFQLKDFAKTAARVERVMSAAADKLEGVAAS